jgi:hypothetical protein
MPRIVVVGIDPDQKVIEAFDRRMRAAGWIKGTNARVDYRWGGSETASTPGELITPGIAVDVGASRRRYDLLDAEGRIING